MEHFQCVIDNTNKTTEKVKFSCFIGDLTENRLKLSFPIENEFLLNEIAFVEFKKDRNFNYNYLLAFIGLVFLSFVFVADFSFLLIVPGLVLLAVSLFLNISMGYISIVLRNPRIIIIKLKKREQKKGQIFVKKVNETMLLFNQKHNGK